MTEPLIDPGVDQGWTSDRELDRLAPLAESLHYWSGVYDRWRLHELAAARPEQIRFGRADLAAIDDLRGVHFGQLAAASRRLRQVGEAAARLVESTGLARSGLAPAWPDGVSQRWETLQRDVQDCAARCTGLGFALEIAVIDTVAPVITSAVDGILVRSDGLMQSDGRPSREIVEQRILELSAQSVTGGGGTLGASSEVHQLWRAELDTLVTDYDAVLGLLRATLAEAGATVARIYQAAGPDIASFDDAPFGDASCGAPSLAPPHQIVGLDTRPGDVFTSGAAPESGQASGFAPASTILASVGVVADTGSASDQSLSAGSSSASGGGSSDLAPTPAGSTPGAPAPGSAVLGDLGESRSPGPGGAVLGSVPGDDAQYGGSAQCSDSAEYGAGGGASWVGPVHRDKEREASWTRLRALLGEQAGEDPEPDRTGR